MLYILYRTKSIIVKNMRRLLGSTRVSTDNKITIVKEAALILAINKGDILAFYEEDGRIYIEKG
jgi:hypothetical protein